MAMYWKYHHNVRLISNHSIIMEYKKTYRIGSLYQVETKTMHRRNIFSRICKQLMASLSNEGPLDEDDDEFYTFAGSASMIVHVPYGIDVTSTTIGSLIESHLALEVFISTKLASLEDDDPNQYLCSAFPVDGGVRIVGYPIYDNASGKYFIYSTENSTCLEVKSDTLKRCGIQRSMIDASMDFSSLGYIDDLPDAPPITMVEGR